MRRGLAVLIIALAVVGAGAALGQANSALYAATTTTYQCPTDGGSCTLPSGGCTSLAAGDGISLANAAAYKVTAHIPALPDAGQAAFSGGGSLLCCHQADVSSTGVHGSTPTRAWARCKTSMDISMSEAGGRVTYPESDALIGVGSGRVQFIPSAVTHDGGGIASGVMPIDVTISVRRAAAGAR